ncbi:hypothetical protein GCM10010387_36470 [Streptomyces inusitatus]|uniref:Uncharacterized protein n=1 Tax=Streptomyces inusitatus TaxID=68221 RepID=A0A918Q9L4_9ACTN|nr:hypothetical protein GCM10010387_36470 [Streptomyces inusitatus]
MLRRRGRAPARSEPEHGPGTASGSGNARRDSSRIAAVCRSTAAAIPGSTRDGRAAWRCASTARRGGHKESEATVHDLPTRQAERAPAHKTAAKKTPAGTATAKKTTGRKLKKSAQTGMRPLGSRRVTECGSWPLGTVVGLRLRDLGAGAVSQGPMVVTETGVCHLSPAGGCLLWRRW